MSSLRPKAGDLIAAVLPRHLNGKINWNAAARTIVDGEFPHLLVEGRGKERQRHLHNWRGYFRRWVNRNVSYIADERAILLSRYWPALRPEDLMRPVLTEEERRLREAERLERKAQELRSAL